MCYLFIIQNNNVRFLQIISRMYIKTNGYIYIYWQQAVMIKLSCLSSLFEVISINK